MPKIQAVRCLRTRRDASWLIVKVLTDQPGLYGIGSASDCVHVDTIQTALESVIGPSLIGRDVAEIEDIWQTTHTHAYWRNGSILNTALGGVDMALWDIKGKEAGMPLYQLLGGKCRAAVPCYAHAGGNSFAELEDAVRAYLDEGFTVVRCQMGGGYGGGGFVPVAQPAGGGQGGRAFDDEAYLTEIPAMFAHLRGALGFGPKLTHDVHSHLHPHNAVALCKLLEPYRLFFLEDVLPPEQIAWFRMIRQQCATPQAIGELFVSPHEWQPLLSERLIDYVRVRVSKGGGVTRCRKIAALAEWFGVQTAWQEGGDNDPVNQAAAVHLDLACWNFGIQEQNHFSEAERDAFPGHVVREGGYLYVSERPGLGVDIVEEKAAALLDPDASRRPRHWVLDRRRDGTAVRP